MNLYDAADMLGAVLVIIAYFATQQRWLSAEDWRFPAINLVGAVLVLISLSVDWNLASFVIELLWLVISAYGLFKSARA